MTININIHGYNADDGIEIVNEMAWNSNGITLRQKITKLELTLYLPLEQWYNLRKVFPKASNYTWSVKGGENGHASFIADHYKADQLAGKHLLDQMGTKSSALDSLITKAQSGDVETLVLS